MQDETLHHERPQTSPSAAIDTHPIDTKKKVQKQPEFEKNPGVSDTDRMVFDKKFKNFLNHRQEYLEKARKKASPSKRQGGGKQRPPLNLA